jgi:hypothetical protein
MRHIQCWVDMKEEGGKLTGGRRLRQRTEQFARDGSLSCSFWLLSLVYVIINSIVVFADKEAVAL